MARASIHATLALAAAASLGAAWEPARADSAPAGGRDWGWSIGVLSGATRPDPSLADYQWDTRPKLAWGAQALIGGARFGAGARLWNTATTQQIESVSDPVTVSSHSLELVGRARVAQLGGARWDALASAGRVHLGYHPDRIEIPGSGEASLAPIDTWIGGLGFGVARPLAARWTIGLEIDHRVFALDTAHRNGSVIENGRDTFGEWSARLELARVDRLR